jgi:four helix bundle protein
MTYPLHARREKNGVVTNLEFAKQTQARAKAFSVRVIRMFQHLPKTDEARILGKQVLRSGTSVAANYRAACRSKSRAHFISKLGTTAEGADETLLWFEESGILPASKLATIKAEADELLRMLSASLDTAKRRRGGGAMD